ncbi:MAG: c-type cytochrome [Thiothrix sp.]|uniref:c-type cytochrome n=1 Tax=Thiothrix sp. TaxID=1032 RepID=UPI0026121198|nr:c-type cytochrome [Thiothrix sp.]MDD5391773.1 c-type cytochrome [Thiothrix sp.]
MAHSTPNDPMAKPILIGGLALIGAAVFVLVSSLFSTIGKNSIKGAEDTTMQAAAADANLAPIGSVNKVDKSVVKAARSGEAVYSAVCTSCHGAGVLGAPKIDDKAAWAPRVAQGLDGLLKNAVNGIRSMPARGGDPAITDEELSNAIVYMTGKAGHDLSGQVKAAAPAAAPAADAKPAEAAAPAAAAPAADAKPAEAAAPAAAAPAADAKPAEAAAPVAAAPAADAKPAEAAAPAAAADGEKVYKATCFACHDVGVAGSPKLGDKADWGPRIARGADALYKSAVEGRMNVTPGKVMPAKGGNPSLSDADVKAAVDFMVGKAK